MSVYNFIFQVTVHWQQVNIEENGWLEMNEKKENVLQWLLVEQWLLIHPKFQNDKGCFEP